MLIDNGVVLLRAIEYDDLPFLQEMMNDPGIEIMTGGSCFPVPWIGRSGGLNPTTSRKNYAA